MGRFIPVDPEKWAAMVIAQSDLVRYKEICDELDAECTRLKAEVERLTAFTTRTIIPNEELEAENARLKAEVEKLECDAETSYRESMNDEYDLDWLNKINNGLMKEKEKLQAQVERLTKQNALATPRHLIASQDIKTLREQIEELKLENSQYEEHHKYGQNVITSLREEVERLTALVESNLNQSKRAMANSDAYVRSLEARVERLTKAGDAMVDMVDWEVPYERRKKLEAEWNAAKEGKQS